MRIRIITQIRRIIRISDRIQTPLFIYSRVQKIKKISYNLLIVFLITNPAAGEGYYNYHKNISIKRQKVNAFL